MAAEEKKILITSSEQCKKNKSEKVAGYKTFRGHDVTEGNIEEKSFKRKLFVYAIICFSMFNVGWSYSLLGPSFPDLLTITGVDSGAGSIFVSANHAGMFLGSFLCGFIIDRYNEYLVLMGASFCFASATIAYPVCSIYWTMILVNLLQGFGCGTLLTGAFTKCGRLWASGASARSFMQAFQLCIPIGSILSPLMVSPFLSRDSPKEILTTTSQDMVSINLSWTTYTAINDGSSPVSALANVIDASTHPDIHSNHTPGTIDSDAVRNQRLIIPFTISASLIFLLMLLLLGKFVEHPRLKAAEKKSDATNSKMDGQKPPMSVIVQIVRLYLVGQLGFLEKGCQNSFVQFFPVFLHREMGWTKELGSDMMSAYWVFMALGRSIGIPVSYYISSPTYLFFDVLFFKVSMVVLLVGTYLKLDLLMWLSAGSIGLALSTFSPCLVSWSHSEILSKSGKHNSFLTLTNCLGSVVLPLVIGYLMELDYIWFVFVLLASSLLLVVNIACLIVFTRIKLRFKKYSGNLVFHNNTTENAHLID